MCLKQKGPLEPGSSGKAPASVGARPRVPPEIIEHIICPYGMIFMMEYVHEFTNTHF
jgi:hypothetical protein